MQALQPAGRGRQARQRAALLDGRFGRNRHGTEADKEAFCATSACKAIESTANGSGSYLIWLVWCCASQARVRWLSAQSETAEFGLVFGLLSSAFKFGLEAANLPNGGAGFAAITTQTQTDLTTSRTQ
jgi:hypothetical protein